MIGKYNTLRVIKEVDFGIYLDGAENGEILLPTRYVPKNTNVDDELEVFIYLDSEDRVIATTEKPFATVGEFAFLQVKSVNKVGAFLDWGLMKDLMVPFREQEEKMEEGKYYPVYVYLDEESNRIVATSKMYTVLNNLLPEYEPGQEVDLFVYDKAEIGYKVVVNNLHSGMIYHSQLFQPIKLGDRLKGFVQKVREDDKIDISLQKPGYEAVEGQAAEILNLLKEKGGFLAVSDKSPADLIYKVFKMSKKSFKKAIGTLYKQRLIVIEKEGIKLTR
ncbi:CvfB family protein [Carboxylicivirga linearis]|uniref:GntR family transcriptional regulator n=1 Tax=Carboxylicivirga linearis TaxID=1628157 RepID=A0ABS5JUB7_9BACT|nr:S1-like domain-containing RNA-binding protein [Carboxylicivirga linearis]MBS2098504.1 GntR family transcriptional regulator [Carboxylicivirga linearis]